MIVVKEIAELTRVVEVIREVSVGDPVSVGDFDPHTSKKKLKITWKGFLQNEKMILEGLRLSRE